MDSSTIGVYSSEGFKNFLKTKDFKNQLVFVKRMKFANFHGFDYRNVGLFLFLAAVPNLMGMINISTPFGFKLHFFQYAVFLAAIIYGPWGGLVSGATGSVYSAALMHNPYIVVGNAILGFFVGLFARYGVHTVVAVLFAYAIQLPWLVLTDLYLVGLSYAFVMSLVIALSLSNLIWAVLAHYTANPLKGLVQ
jgi:hypothetical protein